MSEHFDTGLRADDVDPQRPRPLQTPWGSFALYRIGARVLCAQSFCPHLLGPLFQGTLAGAVVTCPWHQWSFSLTTGERLDEPEPGDDPHAALATCAVSLSPHGTLLLAAPRRRGERLAEVPEPPPLLPR